MTRLLLTVQFCLLALAPTLCAQGGGAITTVPPGTPYVGVHSGASPAVTPQEVPPRKAVESSQAPVTQVKAPPQQETPSGAPNDLMVIDSNAQFIEVQLGRGIIFVVGDIEARIGNRYLRCSSLVAWLKDSSDPSPTPSADPDKDGGILPTKSLDRIREHVSEIYAEGHVIWSEKGQWLYCDRMFLDLQRERGLAIDTTVSVDLPNRALNESVPLTVRADEFRLLANNRLEAVGVRSSVSPMGRPGTYLSSDRIEIIKEEKLSEDGVQNWHAESEGNTLHTGGLPLFWMPDFVGDSAARRNALFIRNFRLRNSNERGKQVGVTIGDDIIVGEDRKKVAQWSVDTDWFSKRGVGVGANLIYGVDDFRGIFFGRYQRDHGEDENFGPPPTKNRGRLSWWHRHQLPEDFQLDLELQLFSDRGYFPAWQENQFKALKPPENLIYLKRAFFNSQVSGLVSNRFNDWLTTVEQQPELRYDLITDPLFDIGNHPLYLTVTARASKSRLEFDEDLDITPQGTFRADIDTLFEYAFPVGPFKLTPFAGVRYSWFEKNRNNDRGQDRVGFTFGATAAMQAYRVWDTQGGIFDLNGLRHVVVPELTFRNTVGVHTAPNELIPFDDIERFDNFQAIEFRMRNLFQTVRDRGNGPTVDNFIDLEIQQAYFPNARNNGGNPWSNLDVDLLVRFSDKLQFLTDFEVNYYGKDFEVANIIVGYTPIPEFQTYTGFRHFHETYNAIFVQASYRMDEKWLLSGETAFDLEEDRGLDHRFVLSRIGPEWVFQVGVRADLGENDFSVTISFEPRVLFNPLLQPGALRAEPRLLFSGSQLRN